MRMLTIGVLITKWCRLMLALMSCAIGFLGTSAYALDPPAITPVDQFFVANGNGIPAIPGDWRLTVDGEVATPLSLTLDDLMNYPATTQMATLECFGNAFTPLILVGNANWTGVPLHTILEAVDPLSGAQSIIFHCVDGYRVHFSLAEVLQREDDLLAYSMNGVTLPVEQGYPVRLVLPGNIGTTWAQWVERIEISTTTPSTSFLALHLHAQIFTPQEGTTLVVGTHTISGMAVVGEGREITGVEISTDGGVSWEPAQLLNYFVPHAWKQWEFTWEVSQIGDYVISTRAEDDLGNQQGYPNYDITVAVDYDSDGDALPDSADNCPNDYNPDQADTYPPRKNGIGDACDCEGNFDCDLDVDAVNVAGFLNDFGRSQYSQPCTDLTPCSGDFECDGDVDANDVTTFLEDFGRGQYDRPCPPCTGGEWCIYDLPDTHLMGEPWLNKTNPAFHGVSLLNCADCHDLSIKCVECHFGASGSKSPPGWTHGTFPHDYLTGSAPVCMTCHDLNRSFGNGPVSCHDCHVL